MVSHFFCAFCKSAVVDELCVTKRLGSLAKQGLYLLLMQHNLIFEFPDRIEICEGMVISLAYELHASRIGKSLKAFKNVNTMLFKLIK